MYTEPFVIEYDAVGDSITTTAITLKLRDFEGVDDGFAVDENPTAGTINDEHLYNLRNQGWVASQYNSYLSTFGNYPDNTQAWTAGKNSSDDFDPTLLGKQDFGTTQTARGRFILDVFNEDRTTASGITIPTVTEHYRPSVCAFFAGRAWYAGVPSDRIGTNLYFSQVALTLDRYGKCYQEADPTSEVINEIVASDGGVITIQDCGEIIELVPRGRGILVLASNGVWQVLGTSDSGFGATGYEVTKVSNYGCIAQGSVIDPEDAVFYWSSSAICAISNNQLGDAQVESVTDMNIASLYRAITGLAKRYVRAAYNVSSKVVYWMYQDGMESSDSTPYKKNKVLAIDKRIGAFYTLTLPDNASYPWISDAIATKEVNATTVVATVIDGNGDTVVDTPLNTIVADVSASFANVRQFKFLTIDPDGATYDITFSDFLTQADAPIKFRDWYSFDST